MKNLATSDLSVLPNPWAEDRLVANPFEKIL